MTRASTSSIGGQWRAAQGEPEHHARWRFKGLVSVEHAFLYLAVFLSTFAPLQLPGIFFTVSDVFYCASFALLLLGRRLPRAPLGGATSLWYVSFLLLMFGLLGSSLVNGQPMRGFIVVGQYFFAYVVLLYILVREDLRLLNRLTALFVLGMLAVDLHGIFEFFVIGYVPGGHVVTGAGRLATMLGNPNAAASMNALTLPLLFYLWHAGTFKNLVAIPAMAIIIVTVILTSSNSGLIAVVTSVIVFAGLVMNTRLIAQLLGLAAVVVIVFYFGGTELLPEAFQRRVLTAVESGNLSEAGTFVDRLALMEEAKAMINRRGSLFFGVGADQFRVLSIQGAPVHDMYLLLLAEGGLFALVGWLMFFVTGLSLGLVARIRRTGTYVGGTLIAILLVFLMGATFKPHMYARFYTTPVILALALVMSSLRSPHEGMLFAGSASSTADRSPPPPRPPERNRGAPKRRNAVARLPPDRS